MKFILNTALGIAVATAIVVLSGCTSARTRIVEKPDGENLIVSMARMPSEAYEGAVDDAKNHCNKLGKSFVMVSHKSEYQGMDADSRVKIDTTRTVASALTGFNSRYYESTSKSDDFKETMTFRCQ